MDHIHIVSCEMKCDYLNSRIKDATCFKCLFEEFLSYVYEVAYTEGGCSLHQGETGRGG